MYQGHDKGPFFADHRKLHWSESFYHLLLSVKSGRSGCDAPGNLSAWSSGLSCLGNSKPCFVAARRGATQILDYRILIIGSCMMAGFKTNHNRPLLPAYRACLRAVTGTVTLALPVSGP